MSQIATKVPEITVKPGKMFNSWSTKMKVAALLLALALYVYFLLFIKTIYLKSNRLERIMSMAMETEKMMHNMHTIDQNLALKVERLDEIYEDY